MKAFTDVFMTLLEIAGSLGMFLFGMKIMSDGIQKTAGEKLQKIMNMMTTNRATAVLTGFAITALIQSSSATTVMVVSFVNASLLNLGQAIGVIMGANIGTTVTGWIVSVLGFKFKIASLAIPVIGIGFPFIFSRSPKRRYAGEIMVGFGLLFLGLNYLKESVPDIQGNQEFLQVLSQFTGKGILSFFTFVFVGTLLTIVVQSSSAAMAITLTMMSAGWIDFETAAAIVLGENIGTTITAFLASIGTSVNARRAARAHTLFNLFGVFWMTFLFRPLFIPLVDLVVPGSTAGNPTLHLAMFHTLFNLINTFICIWFVPQLAFVVEKLVKPKPGEMTQAYKLKYIATGLQDTPEINIINAKRELFKMSEVVEKLFTSFKSVFHLPDQEKPEEESNLNPVAKVVKKVVKRNKVNEDPEEEARIMEELTDTMQEEISKYLVSCAKENLNDTSAGNVNAMIRIVNELESIGDSCYNLIILMKRKQKADILFPVDAENELKDYYNLVEEFLTLNKNHLNEHMPREVITQAFDLEGRIDKMRDKLKRSARKRIKQGSNVKGELLFMDMVQHIEHIGDYSLNIAQALREFR